MMNPQPYKSPVGLAEKPMTAGGQCLATVVELATVAQRLAERAEAALSGIIRPEEAEAAKTAVGSVSPQSTYPHYFDDMRGQHYSIRDALNRIESVLNRLEL